VKQPTIETMANYFTDLLRPIGALLIRPYRKTLFVAVLDTQSRAAVLSSCQEVCK
jgi:hypothetical protein